MKRMNLRKPLSLFLAVVMLFSMVGFPAVAEEQTTPDHEHNTDGWVCVETKVLKCEQEEHVHTLDCYGEPDEKSVPVCGIDEVEGHTYTDAGTPVVERKLVCELEETESHTHSDECYTEEKILTCEIPEDHTHTLDCYAQSEMGYDIEIDGQHYMVSGLTCTIPENHKHDDSCYTTESTLACGLEETEGHTHGEDCYEEVTTYSCGLEESEGHTHSKECYEMTTLPLVCEIPEHTHSDECYISEWTCAVPETATQSTAIPEEPGSDAQATTTPELPEQNDVPQSDEGDPEADGSDPANDQPAEGQTSSANLAEFEVEIKVYDVAADKYVDNETLVRGRQYRFEMTFSAPVGQTLLMRYATTEELKAVGVDPEEAEDNTWMYVPLGNILENIGTASVLGGDNAKVAANGKVILVKYDPEKYTDTVGVTFVGKVAQDATEGGIILGDTDSLQFTIVSPKDPTIEKVAEEYNGNGYIKYTLKIKNPSTEGPITGIEVTDTLTPESLRYSADTFAVNGEPVGASDSRLTINENTFTYHDEAVVLDQEGEMTITYNVSVSEYIANLVGNDSFKDSSFIVNNEASVKVPSEGEVPVAGTSKEETTVKLGSLDKSGTIDGGMIHWDIKVHDPYQTLGGVGVIDNLPEGVAVEKVVIYYGQDAYPNHNSNINKKEYTGSGLDKVISSNGDNLTITLPQEGAQNYALICIYTSAIEGVLSYTNTAKVKLASEVGAERTAQDTVNIGEGGISADKVHSEPTIVEEGEDAGHKLLNYCINITVDANLVENNGGNWNNIGAAILDEMEDGYGTNRVDTSKAIVVKSFTATVGEEKYTLNTSGDISYKIYSVKKVENGLTIQERSGTTAFVINPKEENGKVVGQWPDEWKDKTVKLSLEYSVDTSKAMMLNDPNQTLDDYLDKRISNIEKPDYRFQVRNCSKVIVYGHVDDHEYQDIYFYGPMDKKHGEPDPSTGEISYTVTYDNTYGLTHSDHVSYSVIPADAEDIWFKDSFTIEQTDGQLEDLFTYKELKATVTSGTESRTFIYNETYKRGTAVSWKNFIGDNEDLYNYFKGNSQVKIVFTYTLQATPDLYSKGGNKVTINNDASLGWGEPYNATIRDKAEFSTNIVSKEGQILNGHVTYTLDINPQRRDIAPSTTLTVTDSPTILPEGAMTIGKEDILVYKCGEGKEPELVDKSEYNIEIQDDCKFTLSNLPDETHLKIEYRYSLTEKGKNQAVIISNSATVQGYANSTATASNTFQSQEIGASSSGSTVSLELVKVRKDGNNSTRVPGTGFILYVPNTEHPLVDQEMVQKAVAAASDINQPSLQHGITLCPAAIFTTDDYGTTNINWAILTHDTEYALLEYVAPAGYQLLNVPVYFKLINKNRSNDNTYSLECTNINELSGYVSIEGGQMTIGNVFKPAKLQLPVKKVIEGDFRDNETFSFNLYEITDENPENLIDTTSITFSKLYTGDGTSSNDASRTESTGAFRELTFDKTGTYKYKIEEVKGNADCWEYDSTVYTVTVEVTKDAKTNALVATIASVEKTSGSTATDASTSIDDVNDYVFEFVNKYKPNSTTVTLKATKTVEDVTGTMPESTTFTFVLDEPMAVDDKFSSNKVIQTKTLEWRKDLKDQKADVTFDPITYDKPGTYTYHISEEKGETPGFIYDSRTYTVVVRVVDYDGKLRASVSYNYSGKPCSGASFENVYKPEPTTVILKASKTVKDKTGTMPGSATFTFNLSEQLAAFDQDKYSVGKVIQTKTLTWSKIFKDKKEVTFDPISFDKPGTYIYQIFEEQGQIPGFSYDSRTYTAVVEVTDNNGVLEASTSYYYGKSLVSEVSFENVYQPEPTSVTLKASKTVGDETGTMPESTIFTFKLDKQKNVSVGGKYSSNEVIQTKTLTWSKDFSDEKVDVTFDSITYDEPGTYTYHISEEKGRTVGFRYDSRTYTVVVEVLDNNGVLEASTNYYYGKDPVSGASFENIYKPEPATVTLKATKTVVDETGTMPESAIFTFKLDRQKNSSNNGKYSSNEVIQTKTLTWSKDFKDEKEVTFDPITFDQPGTYTYHIFEEPGKTPGFSYDSRTYTVAITVTDNDGKLEADVKYGEENETEASFENVYQPESTSVTLKASKTVVDKTGTMPESTIFTFKLDKQKNASVGGKYSSNEVIQTKTLTWSKDFSDEKVDVTFDPITYDEPGTYTYHISEEKGRTAGFRYDSRTYTVVVEVVDHNGILEASTSYYYGKTPVSGGSFENVYKPEPATVTLKATKTVVDETGTMPESAIFTFKLDRQKNSPNNGKYSSNEVIQTKTLTWSKDFKDNKADVTFDPITYNKPGTYTYHIFEEAGHTPGFSYDSRTYTVIAEVVDNDGKLDASVSYKYGTNEANAEFENVYNPGKTSYTPQISKDITGEPTTTDKTFKFTLEEVLGQSEDGHFTSAKVNDTAELAMNAGQVSGTAGFETIEYVKPGTYKYLIKEVKPADAEMNYPGYTFDDTVWTLTVVIEDVDGDLTRKSVVYSNGNEEIKDEAAEDEEATVVAAHFENKYAVVPTELKVNVTKEITGTPRPDDDTNKYEFTFDLIHTDVDGVTWPENSQLTVTVKGSANSASENFESIKFTKAGTYEFQVVENDTNKINGFTYDTKVRTFTVTVKDQKSQLVVTSVMMDGKEVKSDTAKAAVSAAFVNEYKVTPTEFAPSVTKTVIGDIPANAGHTFRFLLESVDTPDVSKEIKITIDKGQTPVTATFEAIQFSKADTYKFTISEIKGDIPGYNKYDDTIYDVTVVVEDKDSQLTVTRVDVKNRETNATAVASQNGDVTVSFTNYYNTTTVGYSPIAHKVVDGDTPAEDELFRFEITPVEEYAESAVSMPESTEASVYGTGDAQFGEISFLKAGTYEFEISEIQGSSRDYDYDGSTWRLKVTVEDKNSTLVETHTYTLVSDTSSEVTTEAAEFTNVYHTPLGDLRITKTVYGGGMIAPEQTFTFSVTGPNNYDETFTVEGDGEITVPNLVPGTYTVRELDAEIPGYVWTPYGTTENSTTVTVVIVDDDVVDANFTNWYTPENTPTPPEEPTTPDTPDNPGTPDTPDNPNTDQQDFPEENNNPNTPDTPNNPEPNPVENNPNQDLPSQNDVPQVDNPSQENNNPNVPNQQNEPNVEENNPTVDIADEGMPLAPAPVTPNTPEDDPIVDLQDEDVPQSGLPPVTGEAIMSILWIALLVASGIGILVTILSKKRSRT